MKKYLITIIAVVLLTVGMAQAETISGVSQWFLNVAGNYLYPVNSTVGIRVPSLSSSGNCLKTDASGNFSTTTCGSGGGGSGIPSTTPFTSGYIPYATSTLALTNSVIFQNGTNIGINTTTADDDFAIQGMKSANLFEIYTSGGNSKLAITSNGLVGIGTTSPVALLSLNGGTTAALGINFGDPTANLYRSAAGIINTDGNFRVTGSNAYYFGNNAYINGSAGGALNLVTTGTNQNITFFPSGTGNVIINNGNVGIGTTTVNSRLVIQGSGITNASAAETTYNASGTLLTTILNNGNVGIGTTSPGAKLDIYGNQSATPVQLNITNAHNTFGSDAQLVLTRTNYSGAKSGIKFDQGGAHNWEMYMGGAGGTGNNNLFFNYDSGNKVTIDTNGNVGIGTTSPSQLLTVGNNNQFTVSNAGAITAGTASFVGSIAMNGNGVSTASYLRYTPNNSLALTNTTHTAAISAINGVANANIAVEPTYNDSGSSITNTDFLIQRTETSLGTTPGAQYLLRAGTSTNTNLFSVTNTGQGYFFGNLGVGTTAPVSLLTLQGTTSTASLLSITSSSGASLLYVAKSGNVGISTSTSDDTLAVVGNGASSLFELYNSSGVSKLDVLSSGNVGIGTTTPGYKLVVAGTIQQASSTNCSLGIVTDVNGVFNGCVASSRTLKRNIRDYVYNPSIIDQLQPVTYYWKDPNRGSGEKIGFIADDVKKVLPQAAVSGGGNLLAVDPNGILAVVVSELQNVRQSIIALFNRVGDLASKLQIDENKIAAQQNQIDRQAKSIQILQREIIELQKKN